MKKFIISILLSVLLPTIAAAQSMTDEQVIKFVMEQQQMGKSQQQIVTQLMQKGVSIDQIRRIRQKYEKQNGQTSLGAVDITGESKVNDRMRTNNGKVKESDNGNASYRVKENEETRKKRFVNRAEGEAEDNYQMRRELSTFLPDSTEIYDQMYMEEMMAKLNNKRKVFGRDIFNNKNLTFEPNMNIATPQNYRLGAGDVVYIDIYGASQKSLQCTITPDGDAVVEGYGPINIAGLTVAQANAKVRSTLGTRYSSSKIKLTVGQTKTIMVNVMGEVMAPGTYTLSAFASVFHALYMAGGTNDIGTMRNIKVYRNNSLVTTVDIYDYILNGKLSGNIRLADNDVIVVGTYDCMVNMTGKVKRPMFYEMKKEESLATAIKYAGGFAGDAYKKTVRVIRKAGSKYSVFNISEFDMASFHLDDEDSISVDSVIPRYSNMAEIKGAVFRPGLYQVGGEITSVRALLEHAEGCTEDAFTDHAVMHRMKEDRTLEVISVDVAGILNGTVPDIALRNEDVLFVPSKKDLQEEQTLTIHGEVMYPGIYRFADNETLEDFVLQAGGLTDAASVMKVDVARRITNTTATTASDTIAHTFTFALKDGFVIDGTPGFVLKPYDEVYVRRSPGYSEQQNVKIEGEVLFAGTYTLNKKSQRLSEMIKQAGGLTNTAYAEGARLVRKYTPEEKMRDEALLKMAKANANGKDSIDIKKLDLGETYDVGINLDKALASPNSDFDIVLREGDRIIVPEYSGTVRISGDVMYPNTVAYKEGKGIGYYVDQAGGWGSTAKKSQTYIIYMNGTIAKAGYHTKPMPGCQIVVPSKEQGKKMTTAEIVAIGSGTASIATMIATIANLLK
ncbi:MAG: SLBB domain-containing protein [Prevotella sp.]|nr:SLBB domain-containing protein [Prevotella sp.]MDD6977974.1 SLBB domain-containing protein [Prevotellaceae bacterium]MDY4891506.1 SLBB domain-containing protein [Prevotella sp.]MDY6200230.1 SLBB domain-containing protein [Prevotella sp.]